MLVAEWELQQRSSKVAACELWHKYCGLRVAAQELQGGIYSEGIAAWDVWHKICGVGVAERELQKGSC